ncbi:MAG: PP2C family protein-serine/threonine phosphatase [Blastocatellia bacterium]
MTNRRLVTLSVLALIGYFGLFYLFPKTNPAARWNFEFDRATAIERAKAAAASYGYTSPSQTENVRVEYHRASEFYLSQQASPLLNSLFTPVTAQVRLADVKSGSGFEARLNSRGELLGYRRRERSTKKARSEDAPQQAPAAEVLANDQKIADEALKQFLGERYGKFSFLSGSNAGKEDRKFSWAASDDKVRILADVIVREGKVREVWLQSNLTPKFQTEFRSQRSGAIVALSSGENLLVWPAIIPLIIFYFVSLARRRIDHRKTLVFLACGFLLLLVVNSFGSFADEFSANFRVSNDPQSYSIDAAIRWAILAVINLFIAAMLYLFLAPGLALSADSANRRTPNRNAIDLELLLKGKLLRRPVTGGIVAGLLTGGLLAVIAHAVAAIGVFGGASINAEGLEDVFVARGPAVGAFLDGGQFLLFMTFAFLIPLAEAFVKRMWVSRILVFAIAFVTMSGLESFQTSAPALALTSLLQAYLLIWIYRNFGLLAVMISTMASQAALSSAALLAQPSTSLQASGRHAMIGLGVALVAALVGFWKSSEPTEEEIAVKKPVENRVERERLQAEFSVARRAQQHMLPNEPPSVPGIAISAVCHPSRDVGGDLYDFLALPEGKVGVVVADVSGKGVPASLYMTLTKGLLDSIAEYKTDPGEILREVNRHLYDVCRRKTFVTMFLGVIDPGRRTLSYARAGHNPTVIHRASERKTWLLKSPGMGLGLNSGKIFDQSLKVETVRLEQGDKLFFYSDGITEAMNEKRDEYGEDRLMVMAERTNGLNAEQSRDAVMTDVAEFLGPVHPQDDQTLVVLQVL